MEQIEKYVDIYNNIIFTYEYIYRYINTYHRYISYVTKNQNTICKTKLYIML